VHWAPPPAATALASKLLAAGQGVHGYGLAGVGLAIECLRRFYSVLCAKCAISSCTGPEHLLVRWWCVCWISGCGMLEAACGAHVLPAASTCPTASTASIADSAQQIVCDTRLNGGVHSLVGGLPALQEALQHKLRTKNGLTGVSGLNTATALCCTSFCWMMERVPCYTGERSVSVTALRSGLSTFRHHIFFGGGQTSLHTMCLTHDACFHFACCL
jgi:hypothetical protein